MLFKDFGIGKHSFFELRFFLVKLFRCLTGQISINRQFLVR